VKVKFKILVATRNEGIIENTTTTNDCYWGCGRIGNGKNMLGKILMEVRKVLADESKD
jgi:predicted NAD-dependent protein-ADP-ribosyltransferase YbiA (DUF1768 family)